MTLAETAKRFYTEAMAHHHAPLDAPAWEALTSYERMWWEHVYKTAVRRAQVLI